MVDLLTETITATEDHNVHQSQVTLASYGYRRATYTIEWSVEKQMALEGQTTDLDVGTYYLPAPNAVANANSHSWDNFYIPDGTIIIGAYTDTHLAKAGAGTITPALAADVLTAISTAGYNDDTAALAANKLTADADFSVAIAGAVVTAGAFTLWLDVLLSNNV